MVTKRKKQTVFHKDRIQIWISKDIHVSYKEFAEKHGLKLQSLYDKGLEEYLKHRKATSGDTLISAFDQKK